MSQGSHATGYQIVRRWGCGALLADGCLKRWTYYTGTALSPVELPLQRGSCAISSPGTPAPFSLSPVVAPFTAARDTRFSMI